MIRRATNADLPQLRKIWEECYDDPLNYVDFMYDRGIVSPQQTYVIEENFQLVSMACVMDCHFSFRENRIPCIYLFGCATVPRLAGKGYMGNLLKRIESDAKAMDAQMSVLIPGGKMLSGVYAKRGYHSDFGVRVLKLRPGMIGNTPAPDTELILNDQKDISMDEVYAIREAALYEVPHIEWDSEQLSKVLLDAIAYGESMAMYKGDAGASYAIYGMQNKSMFIREILGTNEESTRILLAAIVNEFDPKRVTMRLPIGAGLLPLEGVKKPDYGMSKLFSTTKPLSDLAPYMNLMFD